MSVRMQYHCAPAAIYAMEDWYRQKLYSCGKVWSPQDHLFDFREDFLRKQASREDTCPGCRDAQPGTRAPGSPFRGACDKVASILEEKAKAYGDSYRQGGEFLKGLYPNGVPVEAYDDMLMMVRAYDKMKRIANNPGKPDPGGEDPALDAAGYFVLGMVRRGAK